MNVTTVSKKNRAHRAVLASVLTLALSGVGVAVAGAAQAAPNCPSGYACAWKDRNYLTAGSSTVRVQFENSIEDLTKFAGWDNQITSLYNNGNVNPTYWFTDIGYKGSILKVGLKAGYSELNTQNSLFNDRISSAYFK